MLHRLCTPQVPLLLDVMHEAHLACTWPAPGLQVDIAPFAARGQLLALEFAYGGGISDSGDVPATTAAQVAEFSWVS
jgi:hypothetical protein